MLATSLESNPRMRVILVEREVVERLVRGIKPAYAGNTEM